MTSSISARTACRLCRRSAAASIPAARSVEKSSPSSPIQITDGVNRAGFIRGSIVVTCRSAPPTGKAGTTNSTRIGPIQSARCSPMSHRYKLGDLAARGRLRPLVAIGPADQDSGEQEDNEHWKLEKSEVDGRPDGDEGGDRHDPGDRQRLAT